MRCLNRNKQVVWYSTYLKKIPNTDTNGNLTGTYITQYSPPFKGYFNVSTSKGTSDINLFGTDISYSKTLVTTDIECPIDENSRLWIGVSPENNEPHNYEVTAVARSINSIKYAIKEVSVTR